MRGFAVPLAAACVFCGGCVDFRSAEDKPPPKPTRAEVERVVADTRAPTYWFGPIYGRQELSSIETPHRATGFSYGDFHCDPGSGCTPPAGVWTEPRALREADLHDSDLDGVRRPRCWSRVGKAVMLLYGCDPGGYPQEVLLFTGSRVVSFFDGSRDLPARRLARKLKPLNQHAPWPLAAPRPLSCRELRAVPKRYRRGMPSALRPRGSC